jgi:hypothetical protein
MTHPYNFQTEKQQLKSVSNTNSNKIFDMKLITIVLITKLLIVASLSGQNQNKVQSRIDGTNRSQPTPTPIGANNNSAQQNDNVTSDSGAQRPVSLNNGEISGFFGYDSRYFYRSNPLFINGDLGEETESDMWTNTFYTGVSSVIESDNSAHTPFLTGSFIINDYLADDLGVFNYNTTSISTGIFSYYGGKNTYFAKVTYNMDKSTENDSEDFNEFFPEIGLITSIDVFDTLSINTTLAIGQHSTTIDSVGGTRPEDLMDNLEVYALNVFSFENSFLDDLGLTYRIGHQTYDNGSYSDRKDLSHSFSGSYNFTVLNADQPNLQIFSSYSIRNSNDNTFDYDNVDAGIGISLVANF